MAEKRQASRSQAQLAAEEAARRAFANELNVPLNPGLRYEMEFDGYHDDGENIVLVEITAQIGRQKGAQPKKICTDVLKLAFARALFREKRPTAKIQAYVVFIDKDAMKLLDPESAAWPARAARHYGVTPHFVDVGAEIVTAVRSAKYHQNLTQV